MSVHVSPHRPPMAPRPRRAERTASLTPPPADRELCFRCRHLSPSRPWRTALRHAQIRNPQKTFALTRLRRAVRHDDLATPLAGMRGHARRSASATARTVNCRSASVPASSSSCANNLACRASSSSPASTPLRMDPSLSDLPGPSSNSAAFQESDASASSASPPSSLQTSRPRSVSGVLRTQHRLPGSWPRSSRMEERRRSRVRPAGRTFWSLENVVFTTVSGRVVLDQSSALLRAVDPVAKGCALPSSVLVFRTAFACKQSNRRKQ